MLRRRYSLSALSVFGNFDQPQLASLVMLRYLGSSVNLSKTLAGSPLRAADRAGPTNDNQPALAGLRG
jgi:hypothetical protein